MHGRAFEGPAADLQALVLQDEPGTRAHELVDVREAVRVHVVADVAQARQRGEVGGERGLQVRRDAGVFPRLHVDRAQGSGGVDAHAILAARDDDPSALEGVEDGAHVLGRRVRHGDPSARRGRGEEVGPRLDAIADGPVVDASEPLDAPDTDGARAGTLDVGAHGAQHVGEVRDLGFAGGVLDDDLAGGERRG